MIRNHLESSFKVSRVEVLEERDLELSSAPPRKIPFETFNMDIDPAVPASEIFSSVVAAYEGKGFECSYRKEQRGLDGSWLVHMNVQLRTVRHLVVMLRENEFFSLITIP